MEPGAVHPARAPAPGYAEGVYWAVGLLAAVGLVASILAHELSHASVAMHHGVKVEEITLWLFGGLARLSGQARDAGTELRIALAGPAMSAAIGAACVVLAAIGAVLGAPELLTATLGWLGLINVVLAVFNLLPGAPLDGGRVLTAILWRRSGDERLARQQAARAGQVVGQVLIALGVVELLLGAGIGGLWLALIGWFLTTAAHAEEAQAQVATTFEGVRVGDVMTTDLHTVDSASSVADFIHGVAVNAHVSSFPVVDHRGPPPGPRDAPAPPPAAARGVADDHAGQRRRPRRPAGRRPTGGAARRRLGASRRRATVACSSSTASGSSASSPRPT